ncbi:MAG TPA: hypothetical protein DHV48_21100 [Prolixibacteraceae bacterium]|nr:hypothetical protein [Prolixibacteraceae bacterium]
MKKIMNRYMCLALFFIGISLFSSAQNSQDSIKSQIETIDGNEYIGIIIEENSENIRIKTDKLGELIIPRSEVKRITQLGVVNAIGGAYWLDNPQATRYFWAPNGYNLKSGEGYFQNVWVLFNQAVYGFTDHFSGGVGVMPLFLFGGTATPAWLMAKFSVPVVENKINMGAGVLAGTVVGEENASFGILYGISTFGSKDKNLNIGLGWGFAGGEMARNPTVNISAMIRTGAKGYFITENYFIGTSDIFVVITMLGGRSIIRRVGLDYGMVIPFSSDMDGFVAGPWLGLTIPFGEKIN